LYKNLLHYREIYIDGYSYEGFVQKFVKLYRYLYWWVFLRRICTNFALHILRLLWYRWAQQSSAISFVMWLRTPNLGTIYLLNASVEKQWLKNAIRPFSFELMSFDHFLSNKRHSTIVFRTNVFRTKIEWSRINSFPHFCQQFFFSNTWRYFCSSKSWPNLPHQKSIIQENRYDAQYLYILGSLDYNIGT
jgi:hypothetical protein